jgi:hypothetical protein
MFGLTETISADRLSHMWGAGAHDPLVVAPPKRVLIDWDWAASGIWLIRTGCAVEPRDLLSPELVDDLKRWNDEGDEIYGSCSTRGAVAAWAAEFWSRAPGLAERVQDELGPDWEVLYNSSYEAGGWTWTWVRQPWACA